MISTRFNYWRVSAALMLLAMLMVACTGDDDDVANGEDLRPITATETAVVGLPEDIADMTVIIENGDVDVSSIDVIAGQPIVVTFANRDAETYTFMVEDLIEETEIGGAAETDVPFNAPNTGEFEGRLLGPDGEEVTTLFVNVTGPGGT